MIKTRSQEPVARSQKRTFSFWLLATGSWLLLDSWSAANMMQVLPVMLTLYSVLIPAKTWYTPSQPLMLQLKGAGEISLVLTDFTGQALDAKGPNDISGDRSIDLRTIYPQV